MDFYELQKQISEYISNNYEAKALMLYGLTKLDKSVMSFPNIDRERQNKILYFDFTEYDFNVLTLESYAATGYVDLYITLRGCATPQVMSEEAAKYAAVFFKLINEDKTLNGIVDEAVIEKIEFYEMAEGNTNYKAAKIKIKFSKEFE